MASANRYTKAPIMQAIIDVRIATGQINLDQIDTLWPHIQGDYPARQELNQAMFEVKMGASVEVNNPPATRLGYAHQSADGKHVLQLRSDGVTFSRMAPYHDWNNFFSEFKRLWRLFLDLDSVIICERVALRYVNRLDLPLPFTDFKEYVLTIPEIAPKIPQMLSGFVMQVHIPLPDIKAMLILNEGLVPPAMQGVASIMLDFDLFKEGVELVELDEVLSTLHERKNDIFEACITDRTRELIK